MWPTGLLQSLWPVEPPTARTWKVYIVPGVSPVTINPREFWNKPRARPIARARLALDLVNARVGHRGDVELQAAGADVFDVALMLGVLEGALRAAVAHRLKAAGQQRHHRLARVGDALDDRLHVECQLAQQADERIRRDPLGRRGRRAALALGGDGGW